jgi:hypothetical protein
LVGGSLFWLLGIIIICSLFHYDYDHCWSSATSWGRYSCSLCLELKYRYHRIVFSF